MDTNIEAAGSNSDFLGRSRCCRYSAHRNAVVKTDDFSGSSLQPQSVSHFPINQTICRAVSTMNFKPSRFPIIYDYEKARDQLEGQLH
jgi:hypothetical protein